MKIAIRLTGDTDICIRSMPRHDQRKDSQEGSVDSMQSLKLVAQGSNKALTTSIATSSVATLD